MNKGFAAGFAGGAIIAAVVGVLAASKGDTPIEVADGSVGLYYKNGFDVAAANRIKASKLFHRILEIQVWEKNGTSSSENIDVKGRDWTLTSANTTLVMQKSSGTFTDDVPISTTGNTNILPVIPGDTVRFRYDDGSQFTPATLSFTDVTADKPRPACANPVPGTNNCTLRCPITNYCSVRFVYK
jgi:hypothetical protein